MYIIRAQLLEVSKPLVWRRFRCADDATFAEFHRNLVRAFGWLDYHLHEFRSSLEYDNAVVIGRAHDDDYWDGPPIDEELVQIQQVFSHTKKFYWIYDFGDDWQIELTCQKESAEPASGIVRIGSSGKAPPEDCGGPDGFERMKAAFRDDPDGEEAQRYRVWMGLKDGEEWSPR